MATQIQLRRSTTAEWAAANPVLAQGEVGIDLTLGEMRLGDGVTPWAGLTSIGAVDPADVDAAVAAYLVAHLPAAYPVQQVTLTGNLAYTMPVGAPTDQVIGVVFTQDGTGGHTVTYSGSPVTVDAEAGAQTEVELWPNGTATRTVVYPGAAGAASPLVQIGSLDLPAAPTAGQSVTALADSNTTIPAGVTWDEGGDPVIAAGSRRIVTLVYDGAGWVGTYSLPLPAAADTTAPTVGTMAVTNVGNSGFTLTVSAAADETQLAASPYAFTINGGTAWSAYQSSPAYTPTGLAADTAYSCNWRVKDAAGNVSTGTAQTVTTSASVDTIDPTWTATFTMGTPGSSTVTATASALAADNVGVTGYEVSYNDGTTWATIAPSGSVFTLTGTFDTTYATTKLRALDGEGNTSAALSVPSYTMAGPPAPPDLGWLASYWVDDIVATDGDPVAAWGDRGGLYDAAQANSVRRPIYRASDAEFGGAPVLDFTTVNSCIVTSGWMADAQPNTVVLVAAVPTPTGNRWIVDGIDANNRNGVLIAPDRKIGMFAGSTVYSGSQLDPAPHLVCAVFNGTSSAAYIDDTGYNTLITPGAQGLAGLTIGARYSNNIDGFMGRAAFVGVLQGAITPQQLTALNAWTAERYGL